MNPIEHILAIPKKTLDDVGYFQGFTPNVEPYLDSFFKKGVATFLPRPEAEKDPTHKQLIPYCIFLCNNKFLAYERGNKGGEARLHAKYSLGVGGHINPIDLNDQSEYFDKTTYEKAVARELEEELNIKATITNRKIIGLINDDSNSVGKVHLGVVELFQLNNENVSSNEEALANLTFLPIESLKQAVFNKETSKFELESWSEILIKNYLK